jgi:manganese/iron transport system substrate-binding protein
MPRLLNIRFLISLITLTGLLAGACTGSGTPTTPTPTLGPAVDHSSAPIKIVVSLPVFADMVKEVTGNQAQVTALIPPGADPQTYIPGDAMIQAVAQADIIFYNGLGLERPTEQFINAHRNHAALFVDFAHNVPSPSTTQPVDKPIYAEQVGDDPHLFLDPALVPVYPETVADSMVIKDGQNAVYYNNRDADYKQRLGALKVEIGQTLDKLPAQGKASLITYHNSLIHFARRYGLRVAGTVADNGRDGLAQIIAETHPPALFTETGYDTAVLTQLANTAGIPVCNLDTDSVTDEGTTYIQMMERDANEISRCLGGSTASFTGAPQS